MKNKKGFTLVEVVVVIAIIAILSLLIVGAIVVARNAATEATNRNNGSTLRLALEAHYARHGVYCGTPSTFLCPGTELDFSTVSDRLRGAGIQNEIRTTPTAGGGGRFTTLSAQSVTYQVLNHDGSSTILTQNLP